LRGQPGGDPDRDDRVLDEAPGEPGLRLAEEARPVGVQVERAD
jgi:hypothetical protein